MIRTTKGFTLVEMLVALAIFSGLMLTLFSSFNAFTKSAERIKGLGIPAPTLGIMISDLEQICILHPPRFQNPETLEDKEKQKQNRFEFIARRENRGGKTLSALAFASRTAVQPGAIPGRAQGITRITYYVHDAGEGLDLFRADRPVYLPQSDGEAQPCTDPVLAKNILGFDLEFFDQKGDVHETWNSGDGETGYRLPLRIDITITRENGKGEEKIRASVFFMVNREVSF